MTTITIQGYEFDAPSPYAEGHVMLANEASALNQTFAENLRNNFAKTVATAKEANGDKLPADVITALHAEFDDYAANYQFGVRRPGEVDPVRLVQKKGASLTEDQKKAMCLAMGLEYRPAKK